MTQPTPTDHETLLARRYRFDVDMSATAVADWQQLIGISENKPKDELRTEDDEAYDDNGFGRETITGNKGSYELKIFSRKMTATSALNPVHVFLKARYELGKTAGTAAAEIPLRVYDRDGLEQAKSGRALIKSLVSEGGGSDALETLSLTLQWQGPYSLVANPLASTLPIVASLSPTGGTTAGGTLVTIRGSKFTGAAGATAVKFGATNATSWTLVDDTRIVAVAPAGAAGTVQVAVTTPGGTSANTAGDDYLYA